jgi:hypothetical protein
VAIGFIGATRFTSSVVEAVLVSPEVPVTVSESAYGDAFVVVFMVSIELPPPVIDDGLNPPLVIPMVKLDSLPTLRFNMPLNPASDVTVTVKVAAGPGTTCAAIGLTTIEKSRVDGQRRSGALADSSRYCQSCRSRSMTQDMFPAC